MSKLVSVTIPTQTRAPKERFDAKLITEAADRLRKGEAISPRGDLREAEQGVGHRLLPAPGCRGRGRDRLQADPEPNLRDHGRVHVQGCSSARTP